MTARHVRDGRACTVSGQELTMIRTSKWTRALGALITVGALTLQLASPANAATRRWNDSKCDVSGYDWYADKSFNGKCAGVDMYWVEVANSSNAVSVTVKYDSGLPWYLKSDEKQRVWLNTKKDKAPEYLITAYRPNYKGTVGRLARVNGWKSSGTSVACPGASIKIFPSPEKMVIQVPRTCLNKPGAVRASVRSFDRFDGGKSWRQDFFPRARTWSPKVAKS